SNARSIDLMQRGADIAIRPTNHAPEHWSGQILGEIAFAAYANLEYWRSEQNTEKQDHRWVVLDYDLKKSPMALLTDELKPKPAPFTVVNTILGVADYISVAPAVAVLPCYLGDSNPKLIRISNPNTTHCWNLWMLTLPDLRRSARVHTFFNFMKKRVSDAQQFI
ncbi:MAG: LysR substrate-binding domain-containing protein, partial [Pseudomonadota bacterium]